MMRNIMIILAIIMLMVTAGAADAADLNVILTFLVLVIPIVMVTRKLMVTTMAIMWLMLPRDKHDADFPGVDPADRYMVMRLLMVLPCMMRNIMIILAI